MPARDDRYGRADRHDDQHPDSAEQQSFPPPSPLFGYLRQRGVRVLGRRRPPGHLWRCGAGSDAQLPLGLGATVAQWCRELLW
ncbi:hypothetical protein [Nocardia nova]|uniref:hypothetical protein n=1 Tax=Nocardia nova TaxID=37330 RepID=UPI0011B0CFA7|nr:hypothetical protein [Nocardia nova]